MYPYDGLKKELLGSEDTELKVKPLFVAGSQL